MFPEIPRIFDSISKSNPLFYEESDFVHTIGERLQREGIRINYDYDLLRRRWHYDIHGVAQERRASCVIEAKYPTKRAVYWCDKKRFSLSTTDTGSAGRVRILRDIARVEEAVEQYASLEGHVVLLTNDSTFWHGSPDRDDERTPTVDYLNLWGAFTDGGFLEPGVLTQYQLERANPVMTGKYDLRWARYSHPAGDGGEFRYLHLWISAKR